MANITAFRAYARLEGAEYDGDASIPICYDAAIDSARIAGVPPMEGSAKYDLLIYATALYMYENRGFSPGMAVAGNTQDGWVERQMTAYLTSLAIEKQMAGGGAVGNP